MTLFRRMAASLLLLAGSLPAGAQCALCYESASQAGQRSQRALTHAVILLLVPPVTMMIGLVGVAFRYGRKRDEE
ncbi:MAG: hypothetical protein JO041_00675 [Acidobacteria bacterium]|nr:hypothetical protein [Acidobacteriota bacterium]